MASWRVSRDFGRTVRGPTGDDPVRPNLRPATGGAVAARLAPGRDPDRSRRTGSIRRPPPRGRDGRAEGRAVRRCALVIERQAPGV
ncbi:hypothetical protein GCM10009818_04020 [Nakamurella flavida]